VKGRGGVATKIEIERLPSLTDHARYAHLAQAVDALRRESRPVAEALTGRTIWMVNSTAQGGGVSEMLPGVVTHLRDLGFATEWVVIDSDDDRFFRVTKRIHNLMHGEHVPGLSGDDRTCYEATNRANTDALRGMIGDGDILIVHDPQPMPLAGMLGNDLDLLCIWRCHIGLDVDTDETLEAWRFLERYADAYDHAVFSAPEYVAPFFEGRSSIIYPALDPLTDKNRPLHVQEVIAILERGGLLSEPGPRVLPRFQHLARRLQPDGSFGDALAPDDPGLLTRPVITQVSRWDRLKGFLPLMHGFAGFRRGLNENPPRSEAERRRLGLTRLLLAGPDPASIADDPEGRDVLDELSRAYLALDEEVQRDVAIIALPMADLSQNALLVNALQRVSTLVAQNSLREGFGLTITEAMWKSVPVLTNSRACGPRQQVRDGVDGRLIPDPEDAAGIARALRSMLEDRERLARWGLAAQRQVHDHFLVYAQISHWVRLLGRLTGAAGPHT
jgi:trehalose synthase